MPARLAATEALADVEARPAFDPDAPAIFVPDAPKVGVLLSRGSQ